MILVPVNDGWQWDFGQFIDIDSCSLAAETYFLGCIADSEQRNSFAGFPGEIAQCFQIIMPPEMLCHNSQTGWAAVHGIGLKIMWKFWHNSVLMAKDNKLIEFLLKFEEVGF